MKITFLEHKAAIERRANNVDNVYFMHVDCKVNVCRIQNSSSVTYPVKFR